MERKLFASHHIGIDMELKEYRPVLLLFAQKSYYSACSERIQYTLYIHTYGTTGFSFSCILYIFSERIHSLYMRTSEEQYQCSSSVSLGKKKSLANVLELAMIFEYIEKNEEERSQENTKAHRAKVSMRVSAQDLYKSY